MKDEYNFTGDVDKSFHLPNESNDIFSIRTIDAAIYYHSLGLNVIPIPKPNEKLEQKWDSVQQKNICILTDGKSAGGYGSWSEWISKKQSTDNVNRLFQNKKDCNIGIITGKVSGIFAFDIDGDKAEDYFNGRISSLDDQEIRNSIKNTMQTKTGSGNGKHIIFAFTSEEFENEDIKLKNKTLWVGKEDKHSEIKLKAEGSYVIAPPSVSRIGNQYLFINNVKPAILSKEKVTKLLSAFEDKRNNIERVFKTNKKIEENDKSEHPPIEYKILSEEEIEQIVSKLKKVYVEGQRDEIIFGLSGLLFKSNVSFESANDLVNSLCENSNDEQKEQRIQVLKNTYSNGTNGQQLIGSSILLKILSERHGKYFASNILSLISRISGKPPLKNDIGSLKNDKKEEIKLLIKLLQEKIVLLFTDQYQKPKAQIMVEDHREIISLEGKKFENYAGWLYYDCKDEAPSNESVQTAVNVILGQARYGSSTIPLNLRSTWGEHGEIYYDLTNLQWSVIIIDNKGWEILPSADPSSLFDRFNQSPQIIPDSTYSDDLFEKYLDLMQIKDYNLRLLIKVWTISALIPDIPHPININFGEKGSSKSTFSKFQKRIVDPDKMELLTIPKDKSEFVQQMHHNYLAVYDNVRYMPPWFSDEACKAITGIGNTKRKLYTDDDDIIYNYKRKMIINGINNSLTEPDALDRSLLNEFDRLPAEKRREEKEIEAEFEAMRPKLFAYVLDIIVEALDVKPTLHLKNLPRMADFAVWGEAISRAMGYKPLEFINSYDKNIGRQNVEAIESNAIAQAILKLVDEWPNTDNPINYWEGSATELLNTLNNVAQRFNIDSSNKNWPKAANQLTRRMRPILSNLREGLGVNITIGRKTDSIDNRKNISHIRIEKVSPLPPTSPPVQNMNETPDEKGGDTTEPKVSISSNSNVSPQKITENPSHHKKSGDTGDSGDTFSTIIQINGTKEKPETKRDNDVINKIVSNSVAFDFECTPIESAADKNNPIPHHQKTKITAAAFMDGKGNHKAFHMEDYSSFGNSAEKELLTNINRELSNYNYSLGWNSAGFARYDNATGKHLKGFDSDLAVLHSRCLANGNESPIAFNKSGIPFIKGQTHIDLYNIFDKPMIQTTVFKNKYRSLKLAEVSKAVLGIEHGGKYKGLSGDNIEPLSTEEQKNYVLRDAQLVMGLARYNDAEILDCMQSISEITGLSFEKVCRTGISSWWSSIFDTMIVNGRYIKPIQNTLNIQHQKQEYLGATVLEPKKGVYHDLAVVDVASLYPTMAILYNISFDTVNCQCCKDDPDARVDKKITKDCNIEKEYWICKVKEGAFPKKLKLFKEERISQKRDGNNVKQLALKILINGGYGVFGTDFFKYSDKRVAELITSYGRYTLNEMQEIAESKGFEVVAGDTDSLFLNGDIKGVNDLIIECKNKLNVDVEHEKTFAKAVLLKKKHYFGITDKGEIVIKGMEGIKNDRPLWINNVFQDMLKDILINGNNPITYLKEEIQKLKEGKVDFEHLKIYTKLSKDPLDYKTNTHQKKIGILLKAKANDLIYHFKSDNIDGVSISQKDISFEKYELILVDTVKDILNALSYDASKLYA